MNRFIVLAAGAALALALGTSGSAQEAAPAPMATPEAAPAAAQPPPAPATADAPAADAANGKARIVFFRPSRLTGAIYTYHIVEVGDDGKPAKGAPRLGSLPNGGAFAIEVEPGVHAYNVTGPMAVNKAEDRLRMEAEPGQTYYVEQTVRLGVVTGGFRLVPSDEASFTFSKAKLDKGK